MKAIFTLCLLFPAFFSIAQNTFRTGVDVVNYGGVADLVQLNDGNFIGIGYAGDDSLDYIYLVKMDSQGKLVSSKLIGSNQSEYSEGVDIIKTSDGNIAISGELNQQISLFKFDTNLNLLWYKQYFTEVDYSFGSRLLQTDDGGYMIAGSLEKLTSGVKEAGCIVKTDDKGNVVWTKQYFDFGNTFIIDIVKTKDGNYAFLANPSDNVSTEFDTAYLVKINGSGDILWSKYVSTAGSQHPFSLVCSSDGGFVINSEIDKTDSSDNNIIAQVMIVKLNQDGNLVWSKASNNTSYHDYYPWGIIEDKDGGYIVSGEIFTEDSDNDIFTDNAYLLKVNSSGTLQWTRTYNDKTVEGIFYGITNTSDGGYATGGEVFAYNDNISFDRPAIYKFASDAGICGTANTFGNLADQTATVVSKTPPVYDVTATALNDNIIISSAGTEANLCSVLPLRFISFNATLQNKSVSIEWKTANEVNTDHFIIERSSQGTLFSALQTVNAKGNSNNIQTYTTNDLQPLFGTSYYRLKQVDKDGKTVYSNVVPVMVSANGTIVISPNPVRDNIRILLQSKENSSLTVQVADMAGKTIITQRATVNAGTNTILIPASSLSKGLYVLKVIQNNMTQSIKFVKE